ncbi:MAG: hypothetical protein ABJM43_11590 [Paracoccaceae bacterium]
MTKLPDREFRSHNLAARSCDVCLLYGAVFDREMDLRAPLAGFGIEDLVGLCRKAHTYAVQAFGWFVFRADLEQEIAGL